jgi:hypothetical protein
MGGNGIPKRAVAQAQAACGFNAATLGLVLRHGTCCAT